MVASASPGLACVVASAGAAAAPVGCLDQLGGIWEIIFWMTLPELLPTGFKKSL
jgi:hypothetical protein